MFRLHKQVTNNWIVDKKYLVVSISLYYFESMSNTKSIMKPIRMPEKLVNKVKRLAKEKKWSFSQTVRVTLEENIK